MRRFLLAGCLVAALCALVFAAPATARDAFAKYYKDYPPDPIPILRDAGAPELIASTRDLDRDIALMWEKGYRAIGHSSFTGEKQDPKDALKQAAAIHARYVIFCQSCEPAAGDSFQSSSEDGGYDQEAVFFAPLKKYGSGLFIREVTAAERDELGRNGAVAVVAVRKGSPASTAGLVAGDKVLSVNDIHASDPEIWNRLFLTGEVPIRVSFIRSGTLYDVTMAIPPEWRFGPSPKNRR